MNIALWVCQAMLAAIFLFAGVMKFVIPVAEMTKQIALPGALLHFVALMEILGALGMILPGLLRIRTGLTPLAAAGFVIIMIGATVFSFKIGGTAAALLPLVTGLMSAFVAYGRWKIMPLQ